MGATFVRGQLADGWLRSQNTHLVGCRLDNLTKILFIFRCSVGDQGKHRRSTVHRFTGRHHHVLSIWGKLALTIRPQSLSPYRSASDIPEYYLLPLPLGVNRGRSQYHVKTAYQSAHPGSKLVDIVRIVLSTLRYWPSFRHATGGWLKGYHDGQSESQLVRTPG